MAVRESHVVRPTGVIILEKKTNGLNLSHRLRLMCCEAVIILSGG